VICIIFKSILRYSVANLANALLSFFSAQIVTLLVVPEVFGQFSMFSMITSLATWIIPLGTMNAIFRHYYELNDVNYRNSLIISSLQISVTSYLVFCGLILSLKSSFLKLIYGTLKIDELTITFTITSLLVFVLFDLLSSYYLSILRLVEKSGTYLIYTLSKNVLNIFFSITFLVFFQRSVLSLIISSAISTVICFVVFFIITSNQIQNNSSLKKLLYIDISTWNKLIRYGLPFVPTIVLSWIFGSMDRMALRIFSDFNDIGIYSIGSKISSILTVLVSGFNTFWAPFAMKKYVAEKEANSNFFKKVSELTCTLTLFVLVSSILLFRLVVKLFPKSYSHAVGISILLSTMPALNFLRQALDVGIDFSGKTYWHPIISLIAVSSNYVLNMIFVPHYKSLGAAFASAVSMVVSVFVSSIISERLFKKGYNLTKFWISFTVIFVGLVLSSLTSNIYFNIILTLALFLMIYLVFYNETIMMLELIISSLMKKSVKN